MKSFFKKLAFVMALAMVVSMAAPAAPVAYAAGELLIARQESKSDADYLTSLDAKVGEEVDLKFYNAPTGWQGNVKLVSSNPAVLVVTDNDYCKVKGVSEGYAVLTLTVLNQTASIKVKVGNPAPEYIVEHKTSSTVEVVFAGAHSYREADITLYRIYEGATGDIRVNWPIESITKTEKGFLVKPFVSFQNEDKYVITIGNEDITAGEGFAFDIALGMPNRLEVGYSCLGAAGKAYSDPNGEQLPVQLDVKYFYNSVDVTEDYKNGDSTYYELTWVSNEDNVDLDDSEGALYFSEIGEVADVKVTFSYDDEEGEPVNVVAEAKNIVSTKVTPYKVVGVVNWTIAKEDVNYMDLVWDVHSIPANDDSREDFKIYAILLDNRGNYIITADESSNYRYKLPANLAADYMNGDINVYYQNDLQDYKFNTNDYEVEYSSANVGKMLVGTDGSLTTYTDATVPAIVSIVDKTGDEEVRKNVSALEVKVTPERKISKVVLKQNGVQTKAVTLASNVIANEYNDTKVYVELYDQYNTPWYKNESIKITTNVEGAYLAFNGGSNITYVAKNGDTPVYCAELALDGSTIEGRAQGKNTINVTLSIPYVSATGALKVSLKDPKYIVSGNTDASNINTTSVKLQVGTPVDLKIADSWKGTGHTVANPKEFAYKVINVNLAEISNSLAVGPETNVVYHDGKNYYSAGTATSSVLYPSSTKTANGDVTQLTNGMYIISIVDPKGNILPAVAENVATGTAAMTTTDGNTSNRVFDMTDSYGNQIKSGVVVKGNGAFDVVVAVPIQKGVAKNVMSYAEEGDYEIKVSTFDKYVLKVSDSETVDHFFWPVDKDASKETDDGWTWLENDIERENTVSLRTKSTRYGTKFTVKNSNEKVTFAYQSANFGYTDDTKSTVAVNIEDIVKYCLKFNLGGKEWNFRTEDLAIVEGRYNAEANYIIITDIYFKVPFNQLDERKASTDTFGYLQKVSVNKSIQVPENFNDFNATDNTFNLPVQQ